MPPELHFPTAVRAIHQSRQRRHDPPRSVLPMRSRLVQLPAFVPKFMRYDRLKGVWKHDRFTFCAPSVFIRYSRITQPHQLPEIHRIFENASQDTVRPQIFIRLFISNAVFFMQIYCGDGDFFIVEDGADLFVGFTARPHLENTSYNACSGLIYHRQASIPRAFNVAVWRVCRTIFSRFCVCFCHCANLL